MDKLHKSANGSWNHCDAQIRCRLLTSHVSEEQYGQASAAVKALGLKPDVLSSMSARDIKKMAATVAKSKFNGGSVADAVAGVKTVSKFPDFSEKAETLKGSIVISPFNNAVKNGTVYIDVEASSYEELYDEVETYMAGIRLKEIKTGFRADISLPASDKKGASVATFYASTNRNKMIDDETITATGNEGFKQAILAEVFNKAESERVLDKTVADLKNSAKGKTVAGAKAIAVVEAMNEFRFFHLHGNRNDYSVKAAFDSVLDGTTEYTNRGHGVRVYFDHDHKGAVRKATFSLDNPSGFGSIRQESVDAVNLRLKNYFDSLSR